MVEFVLIVLAFITSVFEARLWQPSFPDLTLTILLFLFLRSDILTGMLAAFAFGILRDGMDPASIWISPFVFVTYAYATSWLRVFVNMNIKIMIFIYALLSVFAYRLLLYHVHGVQLKWPVLAFASFTSAFLVLLLDVIFRKK